MGELEKSVVKKIRIARIQKAILYTIAALGVLSSPLTVSLILRELKKTGWRVTKRNPHYTISDSTKRLLNAGLIVFDETPKGKFLRLTESGSIKLIEIGGVPLSLKKPRRWDGKWRIVVFDIRETRRWMRAKLRQTLNVLGFVRLQDSVWVYPYDCEDFITLIKADFKVGKDILYIIADRIENDATLLKNFGLKR